MFIQGFLLNYQELRIEDYEAGHKTGATGTAASTGFSGLSTSTSGGLFGNTSSTGFGSAQKTTTGFGTTGGEEIIQFYY